MSIKNDTKFGIEDVFLKTCFVERDKVTIDTNK